LQGQAGSSAELQAYIPAIALITIAFHHEPRYDLARLLIGGISAGFSLPVVSGGQIYLMCSDRRWLACSLVDVNLFERQGR